MFGFFTGRIAALSDVGLGLDNGSDPRMRQGVAALQALEDLTEAASQERAFLNGVFSAGGFKNGEFVQFAEMRADRRSALDRFNRFATDEQRSANAFVAATGAARLTSNFEQVAIQAADGRHILVNPQSWWSGMTTVLDDLNQLQEHVGSQIQLRAHELQQASLERIGALIAIVLLCFAGSIYLSVLASRSITRPLAALASEADNVAERRLPDAVRRLQVDGAIDDDDPPVPPEPVRIPERATREISSVATALDRLQSVAYGLAIDQAGQRQDTIESMANLGRRNQNLVRRQLGFITSLERDEIDPGALANLFELDHLATRMRRNAASLLVLVGASSPRQWSTPVSVADMIRAALSEVEEYRRVILRRVDDALVSGVAVGGVAHLLAELIENGLAFSPPDTEVEIQGRQLSHGYLIAITDQGVGMSSAELQRANARLRGEGDFIATPTRFLGHFVVGKLARETLVDVELLPSPVTGVTARITLPPKLLSPAPQVQEITDTAGQPKHSKALTSAHQELPEPALARLPGDRPMMPPPWDIAAPARPYAARDPLDADQTPPSGLPLPGHPVPGGSQPMTAASALERTITERTFTERIATERTTTGGSGGHGLRATPDVVMHTEISPGPDTGDMDRTRNGLRKRIPWTQRGATPQATSSPRRVIDLDAASQPAEVDGSPDQVRARMTALRAGFQRGSGKAADEPGGDGTEDSTVKESE
jgi:hypothetical protein